VPIDHSINWQQKKKKNCTRGGKDGSIDRHLLPWLFLFYFVANQLNHWLAAKQNKNKQGKRCRSIEPSIGSKKAKKAAQEVPIIGSIYCQPKKKKLRSPT